MRLTSITLQWSLSNTSNTAACMPQVITEIASHVFRLFPSPTPSLFLSRSVSASLALGLLTVLACGALLPAALGLLRDRQRLLDLLLLLPPRTASLLSTKAAALADGSSSGHRGGDGGGGVRVEVAGDTDHEATVGPDATRRSSVSSSGSGGRAHGRSRSRSPTRSPARGPRPRRGSSAFGLEPADAQSGDGATGTGRCGSAASAPSPGRARRGGRPHAKVRRGFVRSWGHAGAGAWVLSWPAFVSLAYFACAFAWRRGSETRLLSAGADVAWTQQLANSVAQLDYHAQAASGACEPGFVAAQTDAITAELARLSFALSATLFGSQAAGTSPGLQSSVLLAGLMMENGCVDAPEHYVRADCENTFIHGAVARGLQAAIADFSQSVQDAARARVEAASGGGCVPQDLTVDPDLSLRLLSEDYLAAGLEAAVAARAREAHGVVSRLTATQGGLTAGALLILAALYLTVYLRSVAMMDRSVKEARRLLLLVPPHVVAAAPALAEATKAITESAGVGGGSAAADVE